MLKKYTIMKAVAEQSNVSVQQIISRSRLRSLNTVRIVLWSAMRAAGYSFPSIGEYTNRDHSTVSELLKKAKPELKAKGREIFDNLVENNIDNKVEQYPELYGVETVRVPDYHQNKIVEIQRIIKKL